MRQLAVPGAYSWSAWQPDRGMNFNGYLLVRDGGNVAVDPLPLDDAQAGQIGALGGVATIVLTNRDHERGALAMRDRFGARVITHEREAGSFSFAPDATFGDGDTVVPGIAAIGLPGAKTPGECALYLRESGCAIVGDAVLGAPAGALSILPETKLSDRPRFLRSLRSLWALRLRSLLTGDGEPLFGGADAALGDLLERELGAEAFRMNADEARWEVDESDPAPYRAAAAEIGLLIGARKLGYRLAELAPGQWFCPYHWHAEEEEVFYVLEGTPTVRLARGELVCRPGDFIALPTGGRGAHQVGNRSDRPARLLLLGMETPNEVVYYPDSRKVGLHRGLMLRSEPALDYYDGEEQTVS